MLFNYPLNCSIVIPTYYPGIIINKLLTSLPSVKEVFILDNGNDHQLKQLISTKYKYINHIECGDIGLGKTFNYSLKIINTENLFITQPDVVLKKNCIENLLLAKTKYPDGAIFSPIYYDENKYSEFDYLDLSLDTYKNIINIKRKKKIIEPWGDFCIEAVASTSNLLDVKKIESLGGWDNYFYTYMEDVDLSLKVRRANYTIIKVLHSQINHKGFASHDIKNSTKMNEKRIYNFTKSSVYFSYKNHNTYKFIIYFNQVLIINLLKLLINLLFLKKKYKINLIRIMAIYKFIISEKNN